MISIFFGLITVLAILVIWKLGHQDNIRQDLFTLNQHERRIGQYIQATRELHNELDRDPTIKEIYLRTWRNDK